MAQSFTLQWTPNITANVTAQRAEYRQKSIGGSFITAGFSPANDLPTSASTTTISNLLDNTVYEFRVANICTVGGPTYTPVTESVKFDGSIICSGISETHTDTTITLTVSGLPLDIIKVVFYDLITGNPIQVSTSGGSATHTFTGLTPSTSYSMNVEFVALVNGVEVTSNFVAYDGCRVIVITDSLSACQAPTNLIVT